LVTAAEGRQPNPPARKSKKDADQKPNQGVHDNHPQKGRVRKRQKAHTTKWGRIIVAKKHQDPRHPKPQRKGAGGRITAEPLFDRRAASSHYCTHGSGLGSTQEARTWGGGNRGAGYARRGKERGQGRHTKRKRSVNRTDPLRAGIGGHWIEEFGAEEWMGGLWARPADGDTG